MKISLITSFIVRNPVWFAVMIVMLLVVLAVKLVDLDIEMMMLQFKVRLIRIRFRHCLDDPVVDVQHQLAPRWFLPYSVLSYLSSTFWVEMRA